MTAPDLVAPGLVVPIRLEALLVGEGDARDRHFYPSVADFARLPYRGGRRAPYLASEAANPPFTGSRPLEPGIHLHWLLPKGLRRGHYHEDGSLHVPHAPDRWLVTRLIVHPDGRRDPHVELRSWIVESDYLDDEPQWSHTSVPRAASVTGGRPFEYLGRVYDYEKWLEHGGEGRYETDLTAIGYGSPDLASYYPSCVNVFGLRDPTLHADLPNGARLSYVVTGWYGRALDDPLNANPILTEDKERGWCIEEFGWCIGSRVSPRYSLFHGAVHGLPWEPGRTYFPDPAAKLRPDVAVGNTPMEGFAALAAARVRESGVKNAERLLDALQLGLLRGLDSPGGLARLEEGIFDASFASSPAGRTWDVRLKPGSEPQEGEANPLADLPTELGDTLAELNAAQSALDESAAAAMSLRAQVFADWQNFMQTMYADPGPGPGANAIYEFVVEEVRKLREIETSIAALEARVAELQRAIEPSLPKGRVELAPLPAPRTYRPGDPVLVVSGEGVPAPPPDDAPKIDCVLTDAIVRELHLPAGLVEHSDAIALKASALRTIADASRLPHAVVAELVQTALLLDPGGTAVPTAAVAREGGERNPAVLDFDHTEQRIAEAQADLVAGRPPAHGVRFDGELPQPDISFREWGAEPWNPIALVWRCDLYPLEALAKEGGEYPASFVLDNFEFHAGSLDYELRGRSFSQTSQEYTGRALLSPDASIALKHEIDEYLRYIENPELRKILKSLGSLGLLAQSLGGFSSALTMRGETPQLAPADPLASSPLYSYFSNDLVPSAVERENRTEPLPDNAYNPLRAGKLVLHSAVLVDEFGRYREVALDQLIVAETIPTAVDEPRALLPPLRIAQGAQVKFRWLCAANPAVEATSLPGMTPICGWVVPNHLDASLMFYDADGAAIGALLPAGDGIGTVWYSAPEVGAPGEGMAEAMRGRNPLLVAFAENVEALGGGYLQKLVRTIDDTRTFVVPQGYAQDHVTPVLVGAPLALVRAAVDMTLAGLPSPDQSLAALAHDIEHGGPLERTTRGFPEVRFPLFLGSLAKVDDGLIGFFVGEDLNRFYAAAAADESGPHILKQGPRTVTVTPGAPAPTTLTMLVDPRCDVHAYNGVTRIKGIGIPPPLRAHALAKMAFAFLAGPVLPAPGPFAIPIPAVADGAWRWVASEAGEWQTRDIAPVNFAATVQRPPLIAEGWLKLDPEAEATD